MKLEGTVLAVTFTQMSTPSFKHLYLPFGAGTGPSLRADILRRKTVLLLVLSLEPQTWDLHPSHYRHTVFTFSLA